MDFHNKKIGYLKEGVEIILKKGKYGHFLSVGKKNYKVPECFKLEELDLINAEKIITWRDHLEENKKETTLYNELHNKELKDIS